MRLRFGEVRLAGCVRDIAVAVVVCEYGWRKRQIGKGEIKKREDALRDQPPKLEMLPLCVRW